MGICAGAIVLSPITQRTNGSVLAAALWHSLYNMTSASAASRGVIAAVTTTCVMVRPLISGLHRRGLHCSPLPIEKEIAILPLVGPIR